MAISPDGTRLAWRQYSTSVPDSIIFAGALRADGVGQVAKLEVNGDVNPVGFAGDRVVLEMVGTPYPKFDVWTLWQNFTPKWTDQVAAVVGLSTGGAVGVAYADSQRTQTCLADLAFDAAGIHVRQRVCGLAGSTEPAWASPDGRWLAMMTPRGEELFDLHTVFGNAPTRVTCPAPAHPGYVFWQREYLYYPTRDAAWTRCGIDGSSSPFPFGGGTAVRRYKTP